MQEVLIDKKLLETFKRRALRAYPNEFALAMWGKPEGDTLEVHALLNVKVDHRDTESIDYEVETEYAAMAGQGLRYVGTLHTHPDGNCVPSPTDIEESKKLDECVMGICAIRRMGKRRFTSFGFFDIEAKQLELTIGE